MKTEIKKQALNENEKKALNEVMECSDMAMQVDEITKCVAGVLEISINSAKGYLSQLTQKGYIKHVEYRDSHIGKIQQFEIL